MNSLNSMVKIAYVGKRAVKKDNVAGTGLVWHGFSDIHEVSKEAAAKLLKHPDVWCKAENLEDHKIKPPEANQESETGIKAESKDKSEVDAEVERTEKIKVAAIVIMNDADPEKLTDKQKPTIGAVRDSVGDQSVTVKELNAILADLEQ